MSEQIPTPPDPARPPDACRLPEPSTAPDAVFVSAPKFDGITFPYTTATLTGSVVSVKSSWQGPYPSPEAVERFEAILPGAFDRILRMAEENQRSENLLNQRAQTYLRDDIRRSHYFGAAVSTLAVCCSTACALTDHPTAAVALVGIPVMAVAKGFLAPRKADTSDESEPERVKPPAAGDAPTPG